MDIFTLIKILSIITVIVGIITVFFVFFGICIIYTNIKTKIPFCKTPIKNVRIILDYLNLPKNSLIIDLGCGDGSFLFEAEKHMLKCVGYELSLFPYLKCLILKKLKNSKIKVFCKDFSKINLSNADAIYIFLVEPAIKKLNIKLKKELKSGAKIISYGFPLAGWEENKILKTKPSKTYIYTKTR